MRKKPCTLQKIGECHEQTCLQSLYNIHNGLNRRVLITLLTFRLNIYIINHVNNC